MSPAATLACPIVSELDRWIANAVQPAAMRWFGAPVAEIKQISAYSCRGMNGNPRARISEHAFGNALDIAAFTLADGRKITVKNGWQRLAGGAGLPARRARRGLRSVHHGAGAGLERLSLRSHPRRPDAPARAATAPATRARFRATRSPRAPAGRAMPRSAAAEPAVTGSLAPRRLPSPPKRLRAIPTATTGRARAADGGAGQRRRGRLTEHGRTVRAVERSVRPKDCRRRYASTPRSTWLHRNRRRLRRALAGVCDTMWHLFKSPPWSTNMLGSNRTGFLGGINVPFRAFVRCLRFAPWRRRWRWLSADADARAGAAAASAAAARRPISAPPSTATVARARARWSAA